MMTTHNTGESEVQTLASLIRSVEIHKVSWGYVHRDPDLWQHTC